MSAKSSPISPHQQLSLPDVEPGQKVISTHKKTMQYEYSESPTEPTGRRNKFVLNQLRNSPNGVTTIHFAHLGVADPRPRIRDLRELGWRIETVQDSPQDVGRYVLLHCAKEAL